MRYKRMTLLWIIIGVSVLIYKSHLQNPNNINYQLSNSEIENSLQETIEQSFGNSRFDVVSVQLESCHLSILRKDSNICSSGADNFKANIFKIETNLLLGNYSNISEYRSEIFELEKPLVRLLANQEASTAQRILLDLHDELLNSARDELGWGLEAAVQATQRFIDTGVNLDNVDFVKRSRCTQDITILPISNDFLLDL